MRIATFETAFAELLAAWVDYQQTPRDPDRIAELAAARWRLEQARREARRLRHHRRRSLERARSGPRAVSTPDIARVNVRSMIGT